MTGSAEPAGNLAAAANTEVREAWNAVSHLYQALHEIGTHDVHYGPWAPPEQELNLLGEVEGNRVLEIGCGGGQGCIALARRGAIVDGLDISDRQLQFAQQLAAQEGATIRFVRGSAESLTAFAAGVYDIVLSINTFAYVADMAACLAECSRVLRPGGRIVFSLDHPLRDCFLEADEVLAGGGTEYDTLSITPSRSYFDGTPLRWRWSGSGTRMQTHHRTIGQWIDLLAAADLRLLRLVEPPPPQALLDAAWPEDDALAPLRLIPQAIIFVAEKRAAGA
jgi:SAM-dependent methyltransferase